MRATAKIGTITVVCCALCAICEGLDLQSAGVAAAGIQAELHPSAQQLGNFFSVSTLGLFIGALIGGRLSDTVGRKWVLIAATFWYGMFSLLTASAGSIDGLVLMRFLTGVGFGGALPNLLALVSESVSEHRRNASVTLVYAAMPFGGAIASLIALLTSAAHWRWIFIAGGLTPLVIVPIMMAMLRESPAYLQAKARSAIDGVGALATKLVTPRSSRIAAVFADGRAVRTCLLWVSFFLGLLTLYLMLSWLPILLVSGGLSKLGAAMAQVGFNLGGAIAALSIGLLLDGRLRTPSLVVTFISMPILLLLLSQVSTQTLATVIVVFLLGASMLAGQAFLYAMAPASYPTLIRGTGVGAAVAMGRIGSIAGPKLGGILKAAGHSPPQLLLDLMPIVIVGCIAALALAWVIHKSNGNLAVAMSKSSV